MFLETTSHLPVLAPVLRGVLIGLGAAVPIGPVNVEMARRTLRNGLWQGVSLGAGACSIDVFYAVLSSLSLGRFLVHPGVAISLSMATALFLGYLGFGCLKMAWRSRLAGVDDSAPPPPPRSILVGYGQGLVMTLLNPMTLGFWFIVLPGIARSTNQSSLLLTCAGVFAGTFGWVMTFNGTLSALGQFRPRVWMVTADVVGGVTLFAFAAGAFLRSIRPFL